MARTRKLVRRMNTKTVSLVGQGANPDSNGFLIMQSADDDPMLAICQAGLDEIEAETEDAFKMEAVDRMAAALREQLAPTVAQAEVNPYAAALGGQPVWQGWRDYLVSYVDSPEKAAEAIGELSALLTEELATLQVPEAAVTPETTPETTPEVSAEATPVVPDVVAASKPLEDQGDSSHADDGNVGGGEDGRNDTPDDVDNFCSMCGTARPLNGDGIASGRFCGSCGEKYRIDPTKSANDEGKRALGVTQSAAAEPVAPAVTEPVAPAEPATEPVAQGDPNREPSEAEKEGAPADDDFEVDDFDDFDETEAGATTVPVAESAVEDAPEPPPELGVTTHTTRQPVAQARPGAMWSSVFGEDMVNDVVAQATTTTVNGHRYEDVPGETTPGAVGETTPGAVGVTPTSIPTSIPATDLAAVIAQAVAQAVAPLAAKIEALERPSIASLRPESRQPDADPRNTVTQQTASKSVWQDGPLGRLFG